MTAKTALPMSQQVVAWLLNGLGYSETATIKVDVSGSTLKSAKRGDPIPRSWDGLLLGALRLLIGPVGLDLAGDLRDRLRAWDADLGTLPNLSHVPLADQLHAPLTLLVPEVGYRLGATIALVASRAGHPIERFEWLAEPFSERFFGSVVRWLFRMRRPDLSSNSKKRAALERIRAVDWRTIERWSSGKSTIPNGAQLADLSVLFGAGSEEILRLARFACVAGRDLRRWLGHELFEEWAALIRYVSLFVAQLLWSDDGSHGLLAQAGRRLANGGDALLMAISMRTDKAVQTTAESLAAAMSAVAQAAREARLRDEAMRTCLIRLIVEPPPDFTAAAADGLGITLLHEFSRGGWAKFIGQRWRMLDVISRLAAGLDVTHEGATIIATAERQRAAQALLLDVRTFAPSDSELFSPARAALAAQIFGAEMVADMLAAPVEQMAGVVNPSLEEGLDDQAVARSRTLAMRRARRLSEEGDAIGAANWIGRALLVPATARSDCEDLLATLAAQATAGLNIIRPIRPHLRRCSASAHRREREEICQLVLPAIRLAITTMLELRTDPTSLESTMVLASVVPVALRLERLAGELATGGQGAHDTLELVGQLEACLGNHPLVGQAWAALAVWQRLSGGRDAAAKAERQARHFGHGRLLDAMWRDVMLDLSDDVG